MCVFPLVHQQLRELSTCKYNDQGESGPGEAEGRQGGRSEAGVRQGGRKEAGGRQEKGREAEGRQGGRKEAGGRQKGGSETGGRQGGRREAVKACSKCSRLLRVPSSVTTVLCYPGNR